MKHLYKITKGQLITLWVFAIIGWVYVMVEIEDSVGDTGLLIFLAIIIPAVLVFYTLGWKQENPKIGDGEKPEWRDKGYANALLIFASFFVFMSMFNPYLGFKMETTPEAWGYNVGRGLWYILILIAVVWSLKNAKKTDSLEAKKSESPIVGTSNFKKEVIKVGVIILILIGTGIFSWYKFKPVNITAVLNDAIYGTNQSGEKEYSELLSTIFKGYRDAGKEKFPALHELDASNILEVSSFESKSSISSLSALIRKAINELNRADVLVEEMTEEARQKIRDTDFTEEEKVEILKGFNKSLNNETRKSLERQRFVALKAFYEDALDLYTFLDDTYYYYTIEEDEDGEKAIYFEYDSDINQYESYAIKVESSANRFLEADKAYIDYTNESLNEMGIDIKAEDIQNQFR